MPSNWQVHGYDRPIYLNIPYPWAPDNPQPPVIPPDYNPVGSYRTAFDLPDAWRGRRVFLHFDGVNSAFYLWVNGQVVGLQRGQHDGGGVRHHAVREGREGTSSPRRSSGGPTPATSRTRTPGA